MAPRSNWKGYLETRGAGTPTVRERTSRRTRARVQRAS